MAKNVSIIEDGNSKIIENVAKIRTSLIGGGVCDWIPKDDVPLQKLTVTEDGTYRAEQNYYGFSQVTARGIGNVIEGELIEKTITKNGTYNIKDESGNPYGYSKIVVNIDTSGDDSGGDSGGGGGGGITGKDEDGNDTMAETDEDGNIVMTALPTEIKVIIPPTKLEYNRYEEIDYSGISVYAYISKAVHWLGATTTAISEGSANGTVVIDGKSISVSVGDGVTYSPAPAVTYRFVWDGSRWVKSSNYSAEKALWKSDKYPTGKIPFEELKFPIKRANNSASTAEIPVEKVDKTSGLNIGDGAVISGLSSYTIRIPNIILTWGWPEARAPYSGWTSSIPLLWRLYRVNSSGNLRFSLTTANVVFAITGFNTGVTTSTWDGSQTKSTSISLLVATSNADLFNQTVEIDEYVSVPTPTEIMVPIYPEYEANTHTIGPDCPCFSPSGEINKISRTCNIFSSYTYGDKTVYYSTVSYNIISASKPVWNVINSGYSEVNDRYNVRGLSVDSLYSVDENKDYSFPEDGDKGAKAWTMVFGDAVKSQNIGITLPVQWKRPGDGKILETTFTAWMKDDGGNGSAPGPGPAPTPPPPR